EGILRRAAAPAAVRKQAHVLVAVAEVDGGGDARAGAPVVLRGEQLAEAEILVVPRDLRAPREVPPDAAPVAEPRDGRRHAEDERVCAVTVADDEEPLAGPCALVRRREEQWRERCAGVAVSAVRRVMHMVGCEPVYSF